MYKKLNDLGQKDYQRKDREDRSLPYRNWLRTISVNGFFMDIDMFLWRRKSDGFLYPCAITDLSRTDREWLLNHPDKLERYTTAITDRLFKRDIQGEVINRMSELLKIPAFFVLFPPSISWLYVYSFRDESWAHFTPANWRKFLAKL